RRFSPNSVLTVLAGRSIGGTAWRSCYGQKKDLNRASDVPLVAAFRFCFPIRVELPKEHLRIRENNTHFLWPMGIPMRCMALFTRVHGASEAQTPNRCRPFFMRGQTNLKSLTGGRATSP